MPNISEFRSKLNARMNHVIDTGTQKIVRELLDYAEALEKKSSVRPPKQPIILLGPKDIEEESDKKATKKKVTATHAKSAGDPPKPAQPIVLLGPKDIADDATGKPRSAGDTPPKPTQPVVLLGPKGGIPVKKKKKATT